MAKSSMLRAVVLVLVGAIVGTGSGGSAHADRALAPTDRLAGGTLDLRASLTSMHRRLEVVDSGAETDIRTHALDLGVEGRLWFSSRAALRVSVARIVSSSATENGVDSELGDVSGFRDLGLDFSYLAKSGRVTFGGVAAALLPTGDDLGLGRTELSLGVVGAYALATSGDLFLSTRYTRRDGDDYTDVGDEARLSIGLNQRWRRISLVPTISLAHGFAASEDSPEAAFDTLRARALFGYEPKPGLTGFLSVEYAVAEEHRVQVSDRGSGDEILFFTGISYAWDLRPIAARGKESPPPAAIIMTSDSGQVSPVEAALHAALRAAIPRLRLATLNAERRSGEVRDGRLIVELTVAADGSVIAARLEDRGVGPALARAVEAFYLGQDLPPPNRLVKTAFSIEFR